MTASRDSIGVTTVNKVTPIEYIRIIFQCVAYLRDLFPEVVFTDNVLQVAGVAVPIKSIVQNGSKESNYFMECISVLEEPINLDFIESIHLGININSREPNKFCEVYSCDITSSQDTPTSNKSSLIELSQVLNRFNQEVQKLDDLPHSKTYEIWVNFSSKYHRSLSHYDHIPRRSSSTKDSQNEKFDFRFGEVTIKVDESNQLSFESSLDTQNPDFITKLVFPPGKYVNRDDLRLPGNQLLCESKCHYDDTTFLSLPCYRCGRLMILFCYGYKRVQNPLNLVSHV